MVRAHLVQISYVRAAKTNRKSVEGVGIVSYAMNENLAQIKYEGFEVDCLFLCRKFMFSSFLLFLVPI